MTTTRMTKITRTTTMTMTRITMKTTMRATTNVNDDNDDNKDVNDDNEDDDGDDDEDNVFIVPMDDDKVDDEDDDEDNNEDDDDDDNVDDDRVFSNGTLTGASYLRLLEDHIDPMITEILENDDQLDENFVTFQQDGAPPQFERRVRAYLDQNFLGRWIGRRGAIEWPARSPDLSPNDFFLWGYLKSVVFASQPENLEDLRQRIVNECRNLTPEIFANMHQKSVIARRTGLAAGGGGSQLAGLSQDRRRPHEVN
ncbi:putative mediator of RNA polymerase II transcription subunit 12 [Anoplophora glabripennis]|uniref:putative mediator of RNA polymerase II transcription subunit 12 n=1 Tax=Anoplophora glabripennis TaxID=217634 RepID=UPI000873AB81|nr:putative mediator of RNA polymerase II transcription subunit 12 [Anoplophora glabripennis]